MYTNLYLLLKLHLGSAGQLESRSVLEISAFENPYCLKDTESPRKLFFEIGIN